MRFGGRWVCLAFSALTPAPTPNLPSERTFTTRIMTSRASFSLVTLCFSTAFTTICALHFLLFCVYTTPPRKITKTNQKKERIFDYALGDSITTDRRALPVRQRVIFVPFFFSFKSPRLRRLLGKRPPIGRGRNIHWARLLCLPLGRDNLYHGRSSAWVGSRFSFLKLHS